MTAKLFIYISKHLSEKYQNYFNLYLDNSTTSWTMLRNPTLVKRIEYKYQWGNSSNGYFYTSSKNPTINSDLYTYENGYFVKSEYSISEANQYYMIVNSKQYNLSFSSTDYPLYIGYEFYYKYTYSTNLYTNRSIKIKPNNQANITICEDKSVEFKNNYETILLINNDIHNLYNPSSTEEKPYYEEYQVSLSSANIAVRTSYKTNLILSTNINDSDIEHKYDNTISVKGTLYKDSGYNVYEKSVPLLSKKQKYVDLKYKTLLKNFGEVYFDEEYYFKLDDENIYRLIANDVCIYNVKNLNMNMEDNIVDGLSPISIVYGNNIHVITGYNNTNNYRICYTTDNFATIKKVSIAKIINTYEGWCGVAYGNGKFVTIHNYSGYSGYQSQNGKVYLLYSTNASSWTKVALDSDGDIFDIIFNNGKFIIIGRKNLFTSTDGVNWDRKNINLTVNTYEADFYKLIYNEEKDIYVLHAEGSIYQRRIYYISKDLINWYNIYPNFNTRHMFYYNGMFTCTDKYNCYYSNDGIVWNMLNNNYDRLYKLGSNGYIQDNEYVYINKNAKVGDYTYKYNKIYSKINSITKQYNKTIYLLDNGEEYCVDTTEIASDFCIYDKNDNKFLSSEHYGWTQSNIFQYELTTQDIKYNVYTPQGELIDTYTPLDT